MAFMKRAIDLTISLGKGDFGDAGQSNTKTYTGLRVSAQIQKMGDPGFDTAEIRVWGLTPSDMNRITTLGKPLTYTRVNSATVTAGDADSGMSQVFTGTIQSAYQDFADMPEASLNMTCFAGIVDAMKPVDPVSYNGPVDVATVLSGLANRMGRQFENNGVSVILSNPYFSGTAKQQVAAAVHAANIYSYDDGTTLAIWPKTGSRTSTQYLISPQSGLVGYPKFQDYGTELQSLWYPGLAYGQKIFLQTSLTPASGEWVVNGLSLDLESEMPGGAWFQNIKAYRFENVGG